MWIPDNAAASSHGKTETCDYVVDAVSGNGSVMDASVALGDHHAKRLDILARDVALAPNVDLVVQSKKLAVKNVGLPFCGSGDCRINDCGIATEGHAYGHVVVCG